MLKFRIEVVEHWKDLVELSILMNSGWQLTVIVEMDKSHD
jgi:hypothetical protein